MPVEVRVPALGESVLEATVGGWLKSEGDTVAAGDPLVELETEKVAVEVTADGSGVLERIAHREGDTVHVGDVLAVLADGERGTVAPPSTARQASPVPSAPSAPAGPAAAEGAGASAPAAEPAQSPAAPSYGAPAGPEPAS